MKKMKRRGRVMSQSTIKTCEFLGVRYDVFNGSLLKREMYYQTKKRVFEDLGFETKLQKKIELKIKVDGKFHPVRKVHLTYKNKEKKHTPNLTPPIYRSLYESSQDRNTFSDFVLDYINGRISYKALLKCTKAMKVRTTK